MQIVVDAKAQVTAKGKGKAEVESGADATPLVCVFNRPKRDVRVALTGGYAAGAAGAGGAGGVTSFIHRAEQSGAHRRNYVIPPGSSTTVARCPGTRAARTLQTQGAS